MAAVLRDSVFYASLFTSKFLADARKVGGRVVPLPFEVTAVSVATVGDTYNCTVIPGNARVIGLECTTTTNAGTITWQLGDAGSATRYMAATVFATVNTQGALAATGAGFTPTVDTIVVGLFGVVAPTVGAKVTGCIYVIPGA